ncbi:MAG: hypothetical protein HUU35_12105, partial [Armatimonadetes bacterium]|nr:hypothetical protein [Armatimonadota bacterium]
SGSTDNLADAYDSDTDTGFNTIDDADDNWLGLVGDTADHDVMAIVAARTATNSALTTVTGGGAYVSQTGATTLAVYIGGIAYDTANVVAECEAGSLGGTAATATVSGASGGTPNCVTLPANGDAVTTLNAGTMPARDWRSTRPEAKGLAWKPEVRGSVHSLWYEQSFELPAAWRSHRVMADFRRIEGDAVVFLNGQRAAELLRPGGEVELSAQVITGTNLLRVFLTRDYTGISRGFEQDPLRHATRHDKFPIDRWPFGITAPVTIATRPRPAAITDVFVAPSWRRRELAVEVEIEADQPLADLQLAGRVKDAEGGVALELPPRAVEVAGGRSIHRLVAPWAAPRLWELEAPYLYTAELELRRGAEPVDLAPPQRFGFREVWTEGRQLLLNGHPMRWRLTWANSGLTPVSLSFYRLLGFNVFQFQPNPTAWWSVWSETPIYDEATLTALDEAGCGATLPVPGISNLKPGILTDARMQAAYEREMRLHIRRYRHHPSILAYAVGMNSYCPQFNIHAQGMGRRPAEDRNGNALAIEYGCRVARANDPTRLAFSHADGSTGDLSTSNSYLNFAPLQEREEWPMLWAESGNMPYSAVEFGEPYTANFWKGKQFLLTEYLAIYFGEQAYAWESEAGQRRIVEYGLANSTGHGAFSKVDLADWPGYWEFQRRFVRATDRAWRTWGVNGGWQYWNFALGYGDPPGYQGNVFSRYSVLREPVASRPAWANPNFEIYRENNQPLLAWLAGAPRFTDKTHAYYSGEAIRKQVALVWDGPGARELTARWWLFGGEETLGQGEVKVELGAGDIRLLPIGLTAPRVAESRRARLELAVLEQGEVVARDRFELEVHPRLPTSRARATLALWDPAGRSGWLRDLGSVLRDWQPGDSLAGVDLLVVGREALEPGVPLPWDTAYLAAGGRVLVLEQQPQIWEGLGFRNVDTAPRQVFAASGSGLADELSPESLRYWRGTPDLLPEGRAARDSEVQHAPKWTNSHAVASTVMEIPHVVGLAPLLACEFDLAYSPLLVWRHGQGQVVFSSLDLSGRVGSDPDATRLAANLLAECLKPAAPRQGVRYLGGPRGRALVERLGVALNDRTAQLLVVGEEAHPVPAAIAEA